MKYGFDYKEYHMFEVALSAFEEKIINDQFKTVLNGNDSFDDKSSMEMEDFFWVFRHGWICRSMCI